MRSLETIQEERSKAASAATIPFLKLTTYSDRDAKTEGTVFYISDRTVLYKYGTGSVIRFNPWLLEFGNLIEGITYLPSPDAGELLASAFSLTLRNMRWPADASGTRVIELLRASYPLEMATVEVSQILVPRYVGPYPVDLSAYAGTEHTVYKRGKVSRLGPITDDPAEIQIQCSADSPEITWNRCENASTAAPRDLGTRFPRPYGAVPKMPLPAHTASWVTTLAEAISAAQTGMVAVTDGSGLPDSGTFYINIQGEEITCTASTDTTITISARGVNAAQHPVGVVAVEVISEAIYIVADDGAAPVYDVTAFYVRNPFNGALARVTSDYTFTAEDTTAESGLTLSTIRISQAQLRSLYDAMFIASRITVQPSFSSGTPPSSSTKEPSANGTNVEDANGVRGEFTKNGTVVWEYYGFDDHRRWDEDFASSGFDNTKDVLKWRLTFEAKNVGTGTGTTYIIVTLEDAVPGIAAGTDIRLWLPDVLNETDEVQSSWYFPPAGTKQSALYNKKMSIKASAGSGHDDFEILEWGIEAQLEEGALDRDVDTEAAGLGLSYELEAFADVEGTIVPEVFNWAEVYDLDDDGGWTETSGLTRTTDSGEKYPGSTASQKLEWDFDATIRAKCESADNTDAAEWFKTNASGVDEATIKTEGTHSVKLTSTSDASSSAAALDEKFAAVDLEAGSGLFVLADVRIKRNGAVESYIRFYVGSSNTDYYYWSMDESEFEDDVYYTVVIDPDETPSGTNGTPDFTAWDYFRVTFNHGPTKVIGMELYIDNIRTVSKASLEGAAQRNSISPTLDMSSGISTWRFAIRMSAAAIAALTRVDVKFDNTVGSGTTMPTPHSYIRWDSARFPAADTWAMDSAPVCNDSGDEDAVQTLQLALVMPSLAHGVYPGLYPLIVYIDQIESGSYASDDYDGAMGTMMEKPVDVARHWIEEVGGATVDETSFAAALTNLGANKLAVDVRTLTPGDWNTGLAGLGFLSRANMLPAETASGTVYKMLTAESDYDWQAADEELTVWQTFAEAGPMEREVWTRHRCLYDRNPALGMGGEGDYQGFLRADEDSNDLTVPSTAELEAAVDKYGNMEAMPVFLGGISDEATAKDVFGFIVHELIRGARTFLFGGCPWWQVHRWEVGDIKYFTHPFSGATVKFRIVGYDKIFRSEANDLRCVEVE